MQYYRSSSPQVVQEMIDGEVVIVNMDNGTYYSTQNLGAAIWQLLLLNKTVDEIVAEICGRYGAESAERIARDVHYIVDSFEKEGLLSPSDAPGAAAEGEPVWPAAYAMPEIVKYVDMQNILLLDPIHEVDQKSGWPHTGEAN